MADKSEIDNEQRSPGIDYFAVITNIGVVIILLLCLLVYFVFEYKLEVINDVYYNINLIRESAKLVFIFLAFCLWLISIIYRKHKQSKVYLVTELVGYIVSMLFVPFYIAYIMICT